MELQGFMRIDHRGVHDHIRLSLSISMLGLTLEMQACIKPMPACFINRAGYGQAFQFLSLYLAKSVTKLNAKLVRGGLSVSALGFLLPNCSAAQILIGPNMKFRPSRRQLCPIWARGGPAHEHL